MIISRTSPTLYNQQNRTMANVNTQQKIAFEGKFPKFQILDKFEERIARGLGKIADTKAYERLVRSTCKHNSLIDETNGKLFAHLTVFGSTLLSIFYVGKTLTNKNLDESKRKTLAINQGLVWCASTALAYTLDIAVKKKFKTISDKFKLVNAKEKDLGKLANGLKIAKGIITVDLVYRFIAPVVVTPLANSIGNKLHNNKVARHAEAQPKLSKQA